MLLRRLTWFFVPLGLLLGVGLGLFLAWAWWASPPVAESPAKLRPAEKEIYLRLVASAYAEERDLRQARERLDALGAGLPSQWVAELARADARDGRRDSAGRLARLALALAVTDEQIKALAATPTPGRPPTWTLIERTVLTCSQVEGSEQALLWLRVIDEQGAPLAGVPFQLAPPGGEPRTHESNEQGELRLPLQGSWTITLPGTEPLSLNDAALVAPCKAEEQDAPHAYRVTFQRRPTP